MKEEMAEDKCITESNNKDSTASPAIAEKKRRGVVSRIWNTIFRLKGDDFEKRLQYISKEEAAIIARMKRRSQTWRRMSRNLIIFAVIFEVIAVGYAIISTRSLELDWKMRALRVLPIFLLPGLSALSYSAFVSFSRMCDRKDQKTLERLRAERQAKIDELKERTNYYTTQQLIERYDPDPAAKAAAATVLACKLGADSGLKVFVEDESKLNFPQGKSNDVEVVPSSGLRSRRQLQTRSSSAASTPLQHSDEEIPGSIGSEGPQSSEYNQLVVNHHYPQGSTMHDGGWIARIAAILVGDDPTQSYALICGNCHMHNGLARKEDFPFITYYCPHCHVLNRPKESEEHISGSISSLPSKEPEDHIASSISSLPSKESEDRVSGLISNSPLKGSKELVSSSISNSPPKESEEHVSDSISISPPKESEEHVSDSISISPPKGLEECVSGSKSTSSSPNMGYLTTDLIDNASSPQSESLHPSDSPVIEVLGIEEAEKGAELDMVS